MDFEQEDIECIWIEILFFKIKGFFVGIIDRISDFFKYFCLNFNYKFELMFSIVLVENKECIFLGDINCNYLVFSDYKEIKFIFFYFGLK